MPTATFLQGLKLAVETDRSTAPSSTHQMSGAGAPWWGGGRWFDVITDGLPTLQDTQAVIFPSGHAGKRPRNQQAPVVGRKWSEGDLSAPVTADFLGALLYGALGGISSNQVPSTAPSLLNNEPIAVNPKSFVLLAQPDGGGNILRFDLKGQNQGGTISISGIDAYGNGASELISFASAGLHYSRTSWSSIGASGVAISGLSAASVTIFGIKRFEHLFFSASSAPTLAIERIGAPTAGAASKSHMHVGMNVRKLTMEIPAEAVDGIFKVSSDFEGDPTGTCNGTSINGASVLEIWPSWTMKTTRDGGTNWYVVKNATLNIEAGNKNYRAGAGVQGPQGKFNGPQEISGTMSIILDNELEYQKWQGASQMTLYTRLNTDWRLNTVASQNYELGASLPMYIEKVTVGDDGDMFSLNLDIRTVEDATWGIANFKLFNGTPGYAYNGGTVI